MDETGRPAAAAARDGDPLILSVQHFCLHDGPGIRSLVFFKGCPLRCEWCQNPESWSAKAQLGFKAHLCIACGTCVSVCPEKAVAAPGRRDRGRCRLCFTCVDKCPSGALVRFGEPRTVESLIEELRPEFSLMRTSGGGVTLSGGEPTMFPRFAAELVHQLKAEGLHVAMETCGEFDLEACRELISALDLILFDVKVSAEEGSRQSCGVGNERIIRNLRTLAASSKCGEGPVLWPRMPLVPGHTASEGNLVGWADLLKEIGITNLTAVPYHTLGEAKRQWLAMSQGRQQGVLVESLRAAREILLRSGLLVYDPGSEHWPASDSANHASHDIIGGRSPE